jgi:hypothetical protein
MGIATMDAESIGYPAAPRFADTPAKSPESEAQPPPEPEADRVK